MMYKRKFLRCWRMYEAGTGKKFTLLQINLGRWGSLFIHLPFWFKKCPVMNT